MSTIESTLQSLAPVTNNNDNSVTNNTTNNTTYEGVTLGVPNKTRSVKTSTLAGEQTLFTQPGSGFLNVVGSVAAGVGGSAIIRIYEGSINAANLIAIKTIQEGTSEIVTPGMCFYRYGYIVTCDVTGGNTTTVVVSHLSETAVQPDLIPLGNSSGTINEFSPNNKYSNQIRLNVKSFTGTDKRCLVKFDFSGVTAGTVITKAELWLMNEHDRDVQGFSIHRILQDWTNTEVCWNERVTGTPWTASGMQAGTDYETTPLYFANIVFVADTYLAFDITNCVQGWINGVLPNYGLLLMKTVDQSSETAIYGVTVVDKKPKIVITPS